MQQLNKLKKIFDIETGGNREMIQPVLNIKAGEKYFSFAVTDNISGGISSLCYWTGEGDTNVLTDDVTARLTEYGNSFYLVKVCYDYPGNMLVPSVGFRHEDASLLKHFAPGSAITITELIAEWQLYNVFAVPKEIHDWVTARYPSAKNWHQVSVSLKNISAAATDGCLQVDIRHTGFSVIVVRNGKLLIAQTYEYNTPEDILYYLLKICRQFSLSQSTVKLELSGLVEKESALYRVLYQYFAVIYFRDAEWKIGSEYPLHFFTSLNDLARCG